MLHRVLRQSVIESIYQVDIYLLCHTNSRTQISVGLKKEGSVFLILGFA